MTRAVLLAALLGFLLRCLIWAGLVMVIAFLVIVAALVAFG